MKYTAYVKQHPNIQLAHAYEHIATRTLNEVLFSSGMFKYADYSLHGNTFEEGGLILLELEVYNPKVLTIINSILAEPFNLGKDNEYISTAMHQLASELKHELNTTDKLAVVSQIRNLNEQPWISLPEQRTLDLSSIKTQASPLFIDYSTKTPKQFIYVSFILNEELSSEKRELLPLFNIVTRILSFSVSQNISTEFGAYSQNLQGEYYPFSKLINTLILSSDEDERSLVLLPSEFMRVALDTIKHMRSMNLSQKIAKMCKSISYENKPVESPSLELIIKETGIMMGESYWKLHGRIENIELILNNVCLEVSINNLSKKSTLL